MFTVITETFFHTSFLHKKLSHFQLNWMIRNARKLDISTLNNIHYELSKKDKITDGDINKLEISYKGLSEPEKYLAKNYGVPETHALSSANIIDTEKLGINFFQDYLNNECSKYNDGALIFLDVILAPFWLNYFEKKIVNAHSAVLPYARGMYAIEQLTATGNKDAVERAAGATLHYVDTGIDTGAIIERKKLLSLWSLETIWAVKGESYLLAFELMKDYLERSKPFNFIDTLSVEYGTDSPLFTSKTFTDKVKRQSEYCFLKMKGI
ncbi:formyltransferase family protein [Xenorhabdus bovienii]|uniref:Formyl transferase N-terminal domain-containing protein n=1 Tax=Xenorhabdus bovienii TaxID=40576 RepID=A0A0B6XFV1_XENBV|nr:formyltransferase family protein [Xenorhabdus bovienii]CDM91364.1 protein of unknown function [Xenorhabdus bovienii]